jgi:hypothetical protein
MLMLLVLFQFSAGQKWDAVGLHGDLILLLLLLDYKPYEPMAVESWQLQQECYQKRLQ